jgi:hypothetical protein
VIPPCCGTTHIRPAFIQCAGANYNPDQGKKSLKKSVKRSACKAKVSLDDLMIVGRIARKNPQNPLAGKMQNYPIFQEFFENHPDSFLSESATSAKQMSAQMMNHCHLNSSSFLKRKNKPTIAKGT